MLYYRSRDEYEAISPCKGSINLGPPCRIKPCTSEKCVFQIEKKTSTIILVSIELGVHRTIQVIRENWAELNQTLFTRCIYNYTTSTVYALIQHSIALLIARPCKWCIHIRSVLQQNYLAHMTHIYYCWSYLNPTVLVLPLIVVIKGSFVFYRF